MAFNKIEELIADIRLGKMVLLVDDEDRENEGDLVLAADHVSAQAINFMATEARGLICLALSPSQIEKLQLPLMVSDAQNLTPNKTAFTVSIEAASGVTTGISASDRAHTIRVASNPQVKSNDVHMPGHIFPIRAQQGGVLKRAGHTEGSVDLAYLAGLNPAAVICEVMNVDGTMARVPDLKVFAKKHDIKIGSIVDLIEYRLSRENLVEEIYSAELPIEYLGFQARVFKSKVDGTEHLVLQKGSISQTQPATVRIQSESPIRDLFSNLRQQESHLKQVLNKLNEYSPSALVILRGANKTMGLVPEIKALQGESSVHDMDNRDYGIGAQILRTIGAQKINLLTNKVEKRVGIKAFDIEIIGTIPLKEEDKEDEKKIYETSNEVKKNQETIIKNWSGDSTLQ